MEKIIKLKIQKLPEGVYLATSDDVQGLVVQGNTLQETIEIVQDVAKNLIELQNFDFKSNIIENEFEFSLVIG